MAAALLIAGAAGQSSIALNEPSAPLLPQSFGGPASGVWKISPAAGPAPAGAISLSSLSKAALEECGPQRSQVADYTRDGRTLHVEAIQFGDRTGAFSAFTLAERPGMRESHGPGADVLGADDAVGQNTVLFTVSTTVVAVAGATAADLSTLKPLSQVMPKVTGNAGIAPLLPSLLPDQGLVSGSARYALGPEAYAAEGGVLPANSLGWDKSAEAVTAQYADKRGKETLTLLLYPTPQIAGNFTRAFQEDLPRMGADFASARIRREGDLVLLANGAFSGDEATRMIENTHFRQEVSYDKDMALGFHTQVSQTASLLANILVLSGVLMAAAVLLGLFLGGGRALVRVMRGKSAAVEPEFLSLHLAPQNKAPQFGVTDQANRG